MEVARPVAGRTGNGTDVHRAGAPRRKGTIVRDAGGMAPPVPAETHVRRSLLGAVRQRPERHRAAVLQRQRMTSRDSAAASANDVTRQCCSVGE